MTEKGRILAITEKEAGERGKVRNDRGMGRGG